MDFKEKLLDSHLAFEQDVDLLHPIHKNRKNALKRFEKDGFPNKNDELWTEGHIDGVIAESIKGAGGFGYDPIFFVPHLGKTFAELSSIEKNKISHRGIALQKLRKILINVLI